MLLKDITMSNLKIFISNEDLDGLEQDQEAVYQVKEIEETLVEVGQPTVAEVIEAEDIVRDVDEETAVAFDSILEDGENVDIIIEEVASMEQFLEVLDYGIKNKEFSPQFAASIQIQMKRNAELFGAEDGVLSVEDYNVENLEEYYVAAFESFALTKARIAGAIERGILKVVNTANKIVNGFKNGQYSSSRRKSIDAVLKKLEDKEGETTVNVSRVINRIGQAGKMPSNPLAAVKKDQAALLSVVNAFGNKGIAYATAVRSAVVNAGANDPSKQASYLGNIFNIKRPDMELESGIKTGSSLIGNSILVAPAPSKEGTELKDKLKNYGKSLDMKFEKIKPESNSGEVKFTKADAVAFANAARVYMGMFDKAVKDFEANLRDFKLKTKQTGSHPRDISKMANRTWGESGVYSQAIGVQNKAARFVVHGTALTIRQIGQHAEHCLVMARIIASKLDDKE